MLHALFFERFLKRLQIVGDVGGPEVCPILSILKTLNRIVLLFKTAKAYRASLHFYLRRTLPPISHSTRRNHGSISGQAGLPKISGSSEWLAADPWPSTHNTIRKKRCLGTLSDSLGEFVLFPTIIRHALRFHLMLNHHFTISRSFYGYKKCKLVNFKK